MHTSSLWPIPVGFPWMNCETMMAPPFPLVEAEAFEVADLVVFLVSERASYLHGTTVNISGGKSRG